MNTPGKNVNDPKRKIHPITAVRAQQNTSQHLSNERTYLSYIRTSIALISFGVTINRFSLFLIQSQRLSVQDRLGWSLVNVQRAGLGMVMFGMTLVIWALLHYASNRRHIDRGDYRPGTWIIWTLATVIVGGGGLSLVWLFRQ